MGRIKDLTLRKAAPSWGGRGAGPLFQRTKKLTKMDRVFSNSAARRCSGRERGKPAGWEGRKKATWECIRRNALGRGGNVVSGGGGIGKKPGTNCSKLRGAEKRTQKNGPNQWICNISFHRVDAQQYWGGMDEKRTQVAPGGDSVYQDWKERRIMGQD